MQIEDPTHGSTPIETEVIDDHDPSVFGIHLSLILWTTQISLSGLSSAHHLRPGSQPHAIPHTRFTRVGTSSTTYCDGLCSRTGFRRCRHCSRSETQPAHIHIVHSYPQERSFRTGQRSYTVACSLSSTKTCQLKGQLACAKCELNKPLAEAKTFSRYRGPISSKESNNIQYNTTRRAVYVHYYSLHLRDV